MQVRIGLLISLLLSLPISAAEDDRITLDGTTYPAPGHAGTIAPTIRRAIKEVLVTEGERVKKGQSLIQLDDDEARIKLKVKQADQEAQKEVVAQMHQKLKPFEGKVDQAKADLEKARAATENAQKKVEMLQPLVKDGVVAEKRFLDAKTAFQQSQADERAAHDKLEQQCNQPIMQQIREEEAKLRSATAEWEQAKSSLEDCTIKAPISGIVSGLKAQPGMIARPGTATWGEVLDLSELDIRCRIPSKSIDQVSVGQQAEVYDERGRHVGRGKVVAVGVAADRLSDRHDIPVLVRVKNSEETLRCYVPVKVRFGKQDSAVRRQK